LGPGLRDAGEALLLRVALNAHLRCGIAQRARKRLRLLARLRAALVDLVAQRAAAGLDDLSSLLFGLLPRSVHCAGQLPAGAVIWLHGAPPCSIGVNLHGCYLPRRAMTVSGSTFKACPL